MFKNYLTIAYRNLLKNKVFSLINILGLAIGMAACLLILQYVSFELSYDDFRKPNIYRLVEYSYQDGEMMSSRAQTTPAIAPAMKRDLPEVVSAARVVHTKPLMSDPVMQIDDRSFHEDKIYFADSSFLELFSYHMLQGDSEKALTQPNSVVISATMAHKYFPNQEALNQMLIFHQGERGKIPLTVTGIFEDIRANSHLHTDFLISFNTIPWNLDEVWDWGNFYNYIALSSDSNPESVEAKIPDFLKKYLGDYIEEARKTGFTFDLDLQPIQNIHLDSDLQAEAEVNGSRRLVEFLTIVAFFILLIAWINYLNLTTTKSIERAKEIGIRKVVGSTRSQLIRQLMTEALLINLLAMGLAFTFSQLLSPAFRNFSGSNFGFTFHPTLGWGALLLFLSGTLLAGLYPAFVLTGYQPVKVLKGKIQHAKQGLILRRSLVIFQFAASIALIIGTLAVQQQLTFMRQQDLGLSLKQTLIVKGPGMKDSTYQSYMTYFKNEAKQLPSVQQVVVSSNVPGQEVSWGRSFYLPANPENEQGANIIAVDEDFLDLYDVKFLSGRNFSESFSTDKDAVIFNESAIRLLGFENPESAIGQTVIWHEDDQNHLSKVIIGVVDNFHQQSLKKEIKPLIFALKRYIDAHWAGEYYSLKLNTKNYPAAMKQIRENWKQAFPNSPFDYFFLDDFFNAQYHADQQFGKIFSLFTSLAIFIACLGLFGLSSYMTLQRTKEIGIRKVLGASLQDIIKLLTQEFIKVIGVASLIILPIAYLAIHHWLENYAYRMYIPWWLLVLPVLLVWFLAMLTISFQTLKAALANPIESLRYE